MCFNDPGSATLNRTVVISRETLSVLEVNKKF